MTPNDRSRLNKQPKYEKNLKRDLAAVGLI